jgi:hypothetical protein
MKDQHHSADGARAHQPALALWLRRKRNLADEGEEDIQQVDCPWGTEELNPSSTCTRAPCQNSYQEIDGKDNDLVCYLDGTLALRARKLRQPFDNPHPCASPMGNVEGCMQSKEGTLCIWQQQHYPWRAQHQLCVPSWRDGFQSLLGCPQHLWGRDAARIHRQRHFWKYPCRRVPHLVIVSSRFWNLQEESSVPLG